MISSRVRWVWRDGPTRLHVGPDHQQFLIGDDITPAEPLLEVEARRNRPFSGRDEASAGRRWAEAGSLGQRFAFAASRASGSFMASTSDGQAVLRDRDSLADTFNRPTRA
jgi:hypothetical protein